MKRIMSVLACLAILLGVTTSCGKGGVDGIEAGNPKFTGTLRVVPEDQALSEYELTVHDDESVDAERLSDAEMALHASYRESGNTATITATFSDETIEVVIVVDDGVLLSASVYVDDTSIDADVIDQESGTSVNTTQTASADYENRGTIGLSRMRTFVGGSSEDRSVAEALFNDNPNYGMLPGDEWIKGQSLPYCAPVAAFEDDTSSEKKGDTLSAGKIFIESSTGKTLDVLIPVSDTENPLLDVYADVEFSDPLALNSSYTFAIQGSDYSAAYNNFFPNMEMSVRLSDIGTVAVSGTSLESIVKTGQKVTANALLSKLAWKAMTGFSSAEENPMDYGIQFVMITNLTTDGLVDDPVVACVLNPKSSTLAEAIANSPSSNFDLLNGMKEAAVTIYQQHIHFVETEYDQDIIGIIEAIGNLSSSFSPILIQ